MTLDEFRVRRRDLVARLGAERAQAILGPGESSSNIRVSSTWKRMPSSSPIRSISPVSPIRVRRRKRMLSGASASFGRSARSSSR